MIKTNNSDIYLKVILWTGIVVLILLRTSSIIASAGNFVKTLEPIYRHPFATTDQKLAMKYPRYYDFIQEIKKSTPEDSTIYLPSVHLSYGTPMWALGQIQMTQTLLYPRTVKKYSGKETIGYLVNISDSDQSIIRLQP